MQNKIEVLKITEFIGHKQPIYSLITARQPGHFFSAGGDKFIVEWDINNPTYGELIANLPYTIYSLCLLNQQNILVAGTSEGGLHFIDLNSKKELKYIRLPDEGVFDILHDEENNKIYASTSVGNILKVDAINFNLIEIYRISDAKIRSIQLHQDKVFAACTDKNIYVINSTNGKVEHFWEAHAWAANCIWVDKNNNLLISGSKDAHLRKWDLKNYSLKTNVPAHNFAVYRIESNQSGNLLASASRDKTVKIWNQQLEIQLRIDKEKREGHSNSVNTITWLNDEILISAGDDRKIIQWKLK